MSGHDPGLLRYGPPIALPPVHAVAIEPSPSGSFWLRLSSGQRIGPYLTRAEVDAGAKRLGYAPTPEAGNEGEASPTAKPTP